MSLHILDGVEGDDPGPNDGLPVSWEELLDYCEWYDHAEGMLEAGECGVLSVTEQLDAARGRGEGRHSVIDRDQWEGLLATHAIHDRGGTRNPESGAPLRASRSRSTS